MAMGLGALFNPALMGPPQHMQPAQAQAVQAVQQPQGLGGFMQNMFQPNPALMNQNDPMAGLGAIDRFKYLRNNNPEALMALSAGLMQGNMGAGFAGASDQMSAYRERMAKQNELEAQKAEAARERNKTLQFFRTNAPEYAAMVDAGMPATEAFKLYTEQRYGGPGRDTRYGLQPIFGEDAEGNTVLGVLGDDGTFKPVDTGDVNVKDLMERERDKALGREQGKMAADVPAQAAGIAESVRIVDAILTHPSLPTAVGPVQGRLPSVTAGSRDFDERVEQLKGRAFLQARQELKGGGQITDFEGARAEAALVRASQAKSEEDFKAALKEFRDALMRGYELLAQQSGQTVPAPAQNGADPLGIRN
jgi:hypothetical protein